MKKTAFMVLAFLLAVLLLAGCSKKDDTTEESGYVVYYTNTEGTKLSAVSYTPETDETDVEALASELLTQLATPPSETDTKIAMPVSVTVDDVQYDADGQCLSVYFSEEYYAMDTITEVLCRAAYVRTLAQIPAVESVLFYVEEEPLLNASGEEVGQMTRDEFVDNTEEEFSAYQEEEITLYFANAEGTGLVETTQEAVLGTSVSTERVVIEALIEGPETDGVYATIPEDTSLLGVSTDDGICYVNLSEAFLVPRPDVTELVTLYSIVNSLCALDSVDQVQFAINGDSDKTYIDGITFSVPLTARTDLLVPETSAE